MTHEYAFDKVNNVIADLKSDSNFRFYSLLSSDITVIK